MVVCDCNTLINFVEYSVVLKCGRKKVEIRIDCGVDKDTGFFVWREFKMFKWENYGDMERQENVKILKRETESHLIHDNKTRHKTSIIAKNGFRNRLCIQINWKINNKDHVLFDKKAVY